MDSRFKIECLNSIQEEFAKKLIVTKEVKNRISHYSYHLNNKLIE